MDANAQKRIKQAYLEGFVLAAKIVRFKHGNPTPGENYDMLMRCYFNESTINGKTLDQLSAEFAEQFRQEPALPVAG